jgi:hypothetical protein
MGTSTSLLLIAAGAILKFAVTAHAPGCNINTVGLILLISLFFWSTWGGSGNDPRRGPPDRAPF